MSSRLRIGIIVAVVGLGLIILGIFAMVRMYQQVNLDPSDDLTVEVVKIEIIVANRDLLLGKTLSKEDLSIVEIPVTIAPRDTLENVDNVVGKILKVDLVKGEMILDHNLASPTNSVFDLSYILSEDHVLIAIPATDLMSKESIIQRGDIVDLFVTMTTELTEVDEFGNETTRSESMTFDSLQQVNITAIVIEIIEQQEAQTLSSEANPAPPPRTRQNTNIKAYLLAMDPQDALVLKFLKDSSAIFDFVLRAPTSTGQFELTPVTNDYLKELYGLEILP